MSMVGIHSDDLTDLIERHRTKTRTKRPSMRNVVIFNDDFTPMDFVVFVLTAVFKQQQQQEAEAITWQIHIEGQGIVGPFSFEIAETKVKEVLRMARVEEHPLRVELEPAQ